MLGRVLHHSHNERPLQALSGAEQLPKGIESFRTSLQLSLLKKIIYILMKVATVLLVKYGQRIVNRPGS